MSFKKIPPKFEMSGSSDIITKKLVQVCTDGRTQQNLVDANFADAYETELEASNFSLEREISAGINLNEQNSLLLETEPTSEQLENIKNIIINDSKN